MLKSKVSDPIQLPPPEHYGLGLRDYLAASPERRAALARPARPFPPGCERDDVYIAFLESALETALEAMQQAATHIRELQRGNQDLYHRVQRGMERERDSIRQGVEENTIKERERLEAATAEARERRDAASLEVRAWYEREIEKYRTHVFDWYRERVLERDGYLCVYCGAEATEDNPLQVDHIWPQSKGGRHEFSNLVTACRSCNASKGAREITGSSMERAIRATWRPIRES